MISVIIPTTTGRRYLDDAVAAYRQQADEVIVVRDRDCCGTAWNDGLPKASGDIIHLGADDFVPAPGALEVGVRALRDKVMPAPRVLRPDGSLECCGSMGGGIHMLDVPDGTRCNMAEVITFLRGDGMEEWVKMCRGLHYYTDDLLSYGARECGYELRVVRAYQFEHRQDKKNRSGIVGRAMQDCEQYVRRLAEWNWQRAGGMLPV